MQQCPGKPGAPFLIALITPVLIAIWAYALPSDLNDLPSYRPDQKVSGAIKVVGSPLKGNIELLEQAFVKYHPDVVFANDFTPSSEGAMAGLYLARADIAPAGDDAKISDVMPFYQTFRYLPTEISIATGGYEARGTLWPAVIVVHKENPISKLTMRQLECIFGSERTGGWEGLTYTARYARAPQTNIRAWGQLGLTGEWSDKQINTYGYASPGFIVYFQRKLFHWSDKWNPNYRQYVEVKAMEAKGASGDDDSLQAVSSTRMLEELSKDKYGIAWAAIMHTKNYPGVKPVAIAAEEGGPYVHLTPETVRNRTYPLVRDAYVYINRAPGSALDPKVKEFLRFILSREGQEIIARAGIYFPLTTDVLEEQRKKLQ